ncbi:Histone-lysine N-methyltransferase ATX4 [Platanthera zijinensis]|uniref:Histone-lysine N-methyltransferase ATX4 n=1 Tax=Platanthera zijinensis TaxID=2320716 RepID=A0AAP0ATX8_9ASPA
MLHARNDYHTDSPPINAETPSHIIKEWSCARTEGFKGRGKGRFPNYQIPFNDGDGCIVSQVQINAWVHINGQKSCIRGGVEPACSDVEHDLRKEYIRYKLSKGWKHLVVYNSSIHDLGLYTSRFITRGAMVVEYVGEVVGLRVADKREIEYQSGRRLQCKSACYFFRIDREQIIDATRKGGIARFVNHSCLPNCVAKVISIKNEKKVVFFAERDINPGEEVTYDYHFNREDEGMKIPCFCNSKNCRRFLN